MAITSFFEKELGVAKVSEESQLLASLWQVVTKLKDRTLKEKD